MYTKPNLSLKNYEDLIDYALNINGYRYAEEVCNVPPNAEKYWEKVQSFKKRGKWHGSFEDLRVCLSRRWGFFHWNIVPRKHKVNFWQRTFMRMARGLLANTLRFHFLTAIRVTFSCFMGRTWNVFWRVSIPSFGIWTVSLKYRSLITPGPLSRRWSMEAIGRRQNVLIVLLNIIVFMRCSWIQAMDTNKAMSKTRLATTYRIFWFQFHSFNRLLISTESSLNCAIRMRRGNITVITRPSRIGLRNIWNTA